MGTMERESDLPSARRAARRGGADGDGDAVEMRLEQRLRLTRWLLGAAITDDALRGAMEAFERRDVLSCASLMTHWAEVRPAVPADAREAIDERVRLHAWLADAGVTDEAMDEAFSALASAGGVRTLTALRESWPTIATAVRMRSSEVAALIAAALARRAPEPRVAPDAATEAAHEEHGDEKEVVVEEGGARASTHQEAPPQDGDPAPASATNPGRSLPASEGALAPAEASTVVSARAASAATGIEPSAAAATGATPPARTSPRMAPRLEEEEDGDAAAGDVGDADGRKGEPPSAPPPPPLEAATPIVVETNQVNEGSIRGVKEEEKEDASASEVMAAQEPTDEVAKESEQDEGEEERQPHQDDDEEAPPRQAHHHEEVDPKQGTAHDDEPGVPTTHDQREGEDDGGGAADEETDPALSAATIVEPIVSSPEMVALLQALALRDAEAISAAAEAARGAGVPAGAVDDLTRDILSSLHREAEARRAAEADLARAADAALVPDLTRALASAVEAGVAAHVIFAATAAAGAGGGGGAPGRGGGGAARCDDG